MIKSLSSLRFLFAILVFLVHSHFFDIAIGHAFFIVLSGFILSMVYEKRFLERKITFLNFFKKRLLRIYPLYILTLFAAIPLTLGELKLNTEIWVTKFIVNMFSLQVFVPDINYYFSFNGVAWNAADLLIFYACFPILVYMFSKLKLKHFTVLIFLITVLISVLMFTIDEEYVHYIFYISPYLRIFDFIFGMYLYKLALKFKFSQNYIFASLLEFLTIIFLILWYWFAQKNMKNLIPFIYSLYLWLPLSLVILVFYFQKGIISKRFFSSHIMLRLGELSFSFYMIHQLVLRYSERVNEKYFNFDSDSYYYLFCFLASLLLAYISNRYFEKLFYKRQKQSIEKVELP